MSKTILLTGATDGIGFETAKLLVSAGHTLLIHGRSKVKLAETETTLSQIEGAGVIESYCSDLSDMSEVKELAGAVLENHNTLDVLINNAGVFKTPEPVLDNGLDVRFVVNTIAPYLLTKKLLPLMSEKSRVINLSSAAQATVDVKALEGNTRLNDNAAYAQSKLAITMWSFHFAKLLEKTGPLVVAVNPASLLASKMVKEAYGIPGSDLGVGADILVRAALSDEFAASSGQYFDNDRGEFAPPHQDALDSRKNNRIAEAIERVLAQITD